MGVFIKQHALKGQKLLAQGNALGIKAISNTPLQGDKFVNMITPRALPWARSFCPFRACCLYEFLPFTFALPFGQRFPIPFGR